MWWNFHLINLISHLTLLMLLFLWVIQLLCLSLITCCVDDSYFVHRCVGAFQIGRVRHRDVESIRSSFPHLFCEICFPGCCVNAFKLDLPSHSADLPIIHLPPCMTLQHFSLCWASSRLCVCARVNVCMCESCFTCCPSWLVHIYTQLPVY